MVKKWRKHTPGAVTKGIECFRGLQAAADMAVTAGTSTTGVPVARCLDCLTFSLPSKAVSFLAGETSLFHGGCSMEVTFQTGRLFGTAS